MNSEEELQSTLVNSSARDYLPNSQPYNRPSSFDSLETTEATSALKTSGIAPLVFEKEDFIEIDDLLIPELGASSTEKAAQFSNHGEFDDFNEFDQLFHDVSMSLDMEPIDQGTSTDLTSVSNFANNTSDQIHQLLYQQLQDQTPENQLNGIMDPSTTLNQFTDDIWFQDDQAVLFDEQQSFSGAFASPSSGT